MSETLERLRTALGRSYRVEPKLGASSMATVYLAFDEKHDRKVAIKVLKQELAAVLGTERFARTRGQRPDAAPVYALTPPSREPGVATAADTRRAG